MEQLLKKLQKTGLGVLEPAVGRYQCAQATSNPLGLLGRTEGALQGAGSAPRPSTKASAFLGALRAHCRALAVRPSPLRRPGRPGACCRALATRPGGSGLEVDVPYVSQTTRIQP